MDLDLKGSRFTWISNPRDGVITKQKIDRIIFNCGWRELYSHAMGLALPIVNSDHSPLVLLPCPPSKCAKFFKYESFWEEHSDCRRVEAVGWNCSNSTVEGWDKFAYKAKNCKKNLSVWHKATLKNATVEITKLKAKLQAILNSVDSNP